MIRNSLAALVLLPILGAAATSASAADVPAERPAAVAPVATFQRPPSFYVHVGLAGVILDEGAKINVGGYRVIGGDISIKPQVTPAVEVGYFFTPELAVSFTGGFPPHIKVEAAGTMNGMGLVGRSTYGPMTLTAHYHFQGLGRFQPYLGLGAAFMVVFDRSDGLMTRLEIDNAAGVALQAGADYMIDDHWGIFVDVKKAYLRTEARGFLGPAPVKADLKLDPAVVHGGVTYRF
jgi:outer membrane protein